jgi:putative peptidoglycan lipid II flippase
MVAWALAGYSIGLVGYAAIKILSPAFYALDDARTPMIISVASIVVNAVASYIFRAWFSTFYITPETPNGLGHVGLALSTSCVALVNFLLLAYLLRRKIKRLESRRILSSFFRIVVASGALSASAYFTYAWLAKMLGENGFVVRLIETFVPIGVGSVVFFIVARFLRIRELDQAVQAVTGRFRRKRA